ncbi:MAG: two-component system, LytTR family, sensor kinase [Anaerophaga sp.]|uniref:sensor histidine kinase n=1 Tax=Anaerophaga thermohalophila TaxID=177400 RepID=UPI000237C883|nr:histidine kinase [Anaerophaga thermohalophila]MDN5291951.1 two-component system, LytTR family, sensor kinase [Anaerophaga sp.]
MLKSIAKLYKSLPSAATWIMLALFYFSLGTQISTVKGLFHAVVLTSMQYLVYNLNLRRFMPHYYDHYKNKFRHYNAILIIGLSVLGVFLESVFYDIYPNMAPRNFNLIAPFIFYLVLCLMAFWVSMTKYLVEKQEKNNIEIETLKRDKAESELKFLKTQINPHFLFNALNNIYTMVYTGDESAPEKITMLSYMLRYVLYDCESDYISLYKEIEYINSFLEFQQLKTEEKQNISFNIGKYDENYQIAPMLLVTFVENAFKHSKIEKDKSGYVKIKLKQTKDQFTFSVENSKPSINITKKPSISRGIGIENARNRLELLYPNKHSLVIINEENLYKVVLKLHK